MNSIENPMADIQAYMTQLGVQARAAAQDMNKATTAQKNAALLAMAAAIDASRPALMAANGKDLDAGREKGLAPALMDRLELTPAPLTR